MKKAVYAGTFDVLTYGHLWMIQHSLMLFPSLTIAIGVNPQKKTMFSVLERMEMILSSMVVEPEPESYEFSFKGCQIKIDSFENKYLIDYAQEKGIDVIIRGIRNSNDFVYEKTMRNINSDLNSKIDTVFLMPPRELCEVSSSMVKGLIGVSGWENVISKYVPYHVSEVLVKKFSAKEQQ